MQANMDVVTAEARSALMSRIRGRDTKPELIVRRLAHALGYRFRLHRRDLPGAPDLVFPGRRKVVFIHGCFWHQHPGCRYAYKPKSNTEFWQKKFSANMERDVRVLLELRERGWSPLVIWECETSDLGALKARLESHLEARTGVRGIND
jgi:DNA mismatch endonuclease (patch repair protein)